MNNDIKPRENELTSVLNRHLFDARPGDVKSDFGIFRWKKFREEYNAAHRLEFVPRYFPLQIDFELNYVCNLACSFCPQGNKSSTGQPKKGSKLTFDDFRKVIDEGRIHGLCSIKLNYINEPLTVPNICEYIRYAKANGVLNVYFATNGILLNETMARELIAAGITKVMISIDAVTAETYLKMRNSDRYSQVVENIFRFIQIRDKAGLRWPLVRVNFVKTPLNVGELDQFVAAWKGVADMIGVEEQVALPGVEPGELLDTKPEDFKCSFPSKLLVIDSEGNILPCCTFSGRSMPLGNIRSMTVSAAWQSQRIKTLREAHASGRIQDEPICMHCIGRR